MKTRAKSALEISRELARVERAQRGRHPDKDGVALMGAQQALAWALGQPAMAPAKCFRGSRR